MGVTADRARGPWTLAMQLAAFLDPSLAQPGKRDWRPKIRQMRAGQALASNWSHKQMLEASFNLVPLRGEAQGAGAVAQSLFGVRQSHRLNSRHSCASRMTYSALNKQ